MIMQSISRHRSDHISQLIYHLNFTSVLLLLSYFVGGVKNCYSQILWGGGDIVVGGEKQLFVDFLDALYIGSVNVLEWG